MSLAPTGGPERLAAGDFARTSLDDVLAMVSVSRQPLCLVLKDGRELGRLVLKSGMVLDALVARGEEGREALEALRRATPVSFELYRVEVSGDVPVIGDLASLWQGTATSANRRLFRGRFADVPMADLLAVLSVSRQTLGIVFWRASVPLGSWVAKAGQILEADLEAEPELDAREAFARLMRDPGEGFTVVEMPHRGHASAQPVQSFFDLDPAESSSVRELVRSGPTASASFGGLLVDVARTRQPVRIVFRHSGTPRGELALHQGRVLWARTASGAQGIDGFARLVGVYARPGTTYEIYRSPERTTEALGTVVDLLAEVQEPAAGAEPLDDPTPRRLFGASFEQVALDDLMAMLSVSRRRLGVVLHRGRRPVGGWVVKSGRVLDAAVLGQAMPPAQAFEVLKQDPGTHFVVVEYGGPLEHEREVGSMWGDLPREPTGEIAPLILPYEDEAPTRDELVLVGSLRETPLFVVLMSLGLSRQHLDIEVMVGRLRIGTISLRSSQVLRVEHTSGFEQSDAMFRLLTSAIADRFRVVRRVGVDPASYVPLGTLDTVLRDLRTALLESGPRLVVPGEREMRAWLDSQTEAVASPDVGMGLVDQDDTPTSASEGTGNRLDELGRRVSTLQLMLLMQGATVVMLLAVIILILVLAFSDVI